MSDAAPPPWVRKLSKRDHGVDAGLKVLLITAWGFGPYQRQGPVETDGGRMPSAPVVIYPCAETLAEESGQPLGTVKDQLRRAARLGWIRRDTGSKFTLAWREPGCFEYGERPAGRPARTVDQPDGGPTMPTGAPTCPDGGPTSDRTVGRPQTFQGTSNSTSSDLAAAHATPSESTTPDGNTDDHNHRHPRGHEPDQPGQRRGGDEPRSERARPEPEPRGLDAGGHRSERDHAERVQGRTVGGPPGQHHRGELGPVSRQLDTPASEAHRGARELRARVGDGLPSAYPDRVTQSSHVDPARKSNGSPGGGHNHHESQARSSHDPRKRTAHRGDCVERGQVAEGVKGPQLSRADFKLIEAHDGGRWAVSLMSDRWAESLAEAMADLNIDAARVCAVLDVWTDHTRDGVTTGVPARRELWWAGGKRGSIVARPWLLRALEATRPKLRVVSGESEYERAKAWAHR